MSHKRMQISLEHLDKVKELLLSQEEEVSRVNDLVRSKESVILNLEKKLSESIQAITAKEVELKKNTSVNLSKINELEMELEIVKSEINSKKYEIYEQRDEVGLTLGINNLSVKLDEAKHNAFVEFDKKCPYCNKGLWETNVRNLYEIDHFYPIAKGGQDYPWNILPVCKRCNRKKKDKLPHDFLDSERFLICSEYLKGVHGKYVSHSITAVADNKSISELVKRENDFIDRHVDSEFVSELLYLLNMHDQIKGKVKYKNAQSANNSLLRAIRDYLSMPVPINWSRMSLENRRNYRKNESEWEGTPTHIFPLIAIWFEVCDLTSSDLSDFNQKISRDLKKLLMSEKDFVEKKTRRKFTAYKTPYVWKYK